MTTFQLKPEDSRKVSHVVRDKVRAPLHKLISYAELVCEEATGNGNTEMKTHIATLLGICEAMLRDTQAITNHFPGEETEVTAALSSSLLEHHRNLDVVARELVSPASPESGESLRKDIATICQTVGSLEDVLKNLSATPASGHSPQAVVGVKNGAAATGAPTDPFIAQVEYLGLLLVVDDDEGNRDVLSRRLLRDGYEVMLAESGKQALRMLKRYNFDLVLLDIMMPGMDGISVLAELKRNPQLNQLPVIMITAVDEIESIAACIKAGADDYLLKPFNPVLLRARIHALLDRKRLQDEQKRQRQELEVILENCRRQTERAEQLLLNILPTVVAEELKEHGSVKPMYFEDVTIVFADIVGFTLSTEQLPADELVELLHRYFTRCDQIVSHYGLEKLKTIGDCYMFGGGVPIRNPSHPVDSVLAATEMITAMAEVSTEAQVGWQLRIGIHTGPVIAGVVGIHKFAFDIWGDSVNFTRRVEACGAPGRINLSLSTFGRVKDFFACEKRERVPVKEGKEVDMYFVNGIATSLLNKPNMSSLAAFRTRYGTFFRKDLQKFPASMFARDQDTRA